MRVIIREKHFYNKYDTYISYMNFHCIFFIYAELHFTRTHTHVSYASLVTIVLPDDGLHKAETCTRL